MPFKFWHRPSFQEELTQIQMTIQMLTASIGGYPPRFQSQSEADNIMQQWQQAQERAASLIRKEPNSIPAQLVLGELLRMGHNIDVPEAAEACRQIVQGVLAKEPANGEAHYILAALYITIHPNLASRAEEHFVQALKSATVTQLPNILQGLGFACLYQQRTQEALTYFERYLEQKGGDPQIVELVSHLKAGETPRYVMFE